MLMCPSPRALIHGQSEFLSQQFLAVEIPLKSPDITEITRKQEEVFVDLRFLADWNRMSRLRVHPQSIARFFSIYNRVSSSCVQALCAKQSHDYACALPLFAEVANSGSTEAMLELGELCATLCVLTSAITWFKRAIRSGSTAALSHLGRACADVGDCESALSLFLGHFALTQSPLTALEIARAYGALGQEDERRCWLRYCAASGVQPAVQELVRALDTDATDPSSLIQWSSVARKLDIMGSPFAFSRLLLARPRRDDGSPPLAVLARQVQAQSAPLAREQRVFSCAPARAGGGERFPAAVLFGARTRTQALLLMLEHASADTARRNLQLCDAHVKAARLRDPVFPYGCALWRAKTASDRPADLVPCAFVSCVLGDFHFGAALFRKAAAAGSQIAAIMSGIILYYGLEGERELERALACMARFPTDPLALAHLGVCGREGRDCLERALAIAGDALFEQIGDLFADGVKLPRNGRAALGWYAMQLERNEKAGSDTVPLLTKIARVLQEDRAVA